MMDKTYEDDFWVEIWRSGVNPDSIDPCRAEDYYRNGLDAGEAARREIERLKSSKILDRSPWI